MLETLEHGISFIGWPIVIWFCVVLLALIILCFYRFFINLRTARDGKLKNLLFNETKKYLIDGDTTKIIKLAERRRGEPVLASLILDLMERMKGEDYDKLIYVAKAAGLNAWATKCLKSHLSGRKQKGLTLMKHLRDKSAEDLLRKLMKHLDPVIRYASMEVLVKTMGVEIIPEILGQLSGEPVSARRQILQTLSTLGRPVILPLLNFLESSDDPLIQAPVIETFAILGISDPADIVLDYLRKSEDRRVQWAALSFFYIVPYEPTFSLIEEYLKDDDWWFRRLALMVLTTEAKPEILKLIFPLLEDPVWEVRYFAAHRLVVYGGESRKTVEAISKSIDNPFAYIMKRDCRYSLK